MRQAQIRSRVMGLPFSLTCRPPRIAPCEQFERRDISFLRPATFDGQLFPNCGPTTSSTECRSPDREWSGDSTLSLFRALICGLATFPHVLHPFVPRLRRRFVRVPHGQKRFGDAVDFRDVTAPGLDKGVETFNAGLRCAARDESFLTASQLIEIVRRRTQKLTPCGEMQIERLPGNSRPTGISVMRTPLPWLASSKSRAAFKIRSRVLRMPLDIVSSSAYLTRCQLTPCQVERRWT